MNQESLKNSYNEPWLAVLLSLIWPGLGLLYLKRFATGILLMAFPAILLASGLANILSETGSTVLGFALLIITVLTVLITLFLSHRSAVRAIPQDLRLERKQTKDPYFALVLSVIMPGLGHLYLARWFVGTALVLVYLSLNYYAIEGVQHGFVDQIVYSLVLLTVPWTERSRRGYEPVKGMVVAIVLIIESVALQGSIYICESYYLRVAETSGDSNYPTIMDGDFVIARRASRPDIRRGSFVAFEIGQQLNGNGSRAIKRVVGFEKEEIFIKDGQVFVNGFPLREPPFDQLGYSADSTWMYANESNAYVVPNGCIFVLGDNPSRSTDSRQFGGVSLGKVFGVVYKIVAPISRVKRLVFDS